MGVRFYFEVVGGALLIFLGILFFVYLPPTFSEITTVLIFVAAGVLVIRRAVVNWTREKIAEEVTKSNQKKTPASKPASKRNRQ
jgi:uncharacterized membrane protein YfcA